jgi:hypothetical protein
MAHRNKLPYLIVSGLLGLFITGCGGGSAGNAGGGSSPAPPPAPGFTLSLAPSIVTVLQGGTEQPVQVSVTGENGFTGSVSVTFANWPTGRS